jgi:hypothetical protein
MEELHNLGISANIVRAIKLKRMIWAGYEVMIEEVRNMYAALVRKSKWKRPLGRHRNRWENNIKMDLREI